MEREKKLWKVILRLLLWLVSWCMNVFIILFRRMHSQYHAQWLTWCIIDTRLRLCWQNTKTVGCSSLLIKLGFYHLLFFNFMLFGFLSRAPLNNNISGCICRDIVIFLREYFYGNDLLFKLHTWSILVNTRDQGLQILCYRILRVCLFSNDEILWLALNLVVWEIWSHQTNCSCRLEKHFLNRYCEISYKDEGDFPLTSLSLLLGEEGKEGAISTAG